MSPSKGSIHRKPRSDSGASRLWAWARARRIPWTASQAAEACGIADRRCRAIVRALADAGLLELVAEAAQSNEGMLPAEWRMSHEGKALTSAAVLIVDRVTGRIEGVRRPASGRDGRNRLRAAIQQSGLSSTSAASRLGLNPRTLRRLISGETPISMDDPVMERLSELG